MFFLRKYLGIQIYQFSKLFFQFEYKEKLSVDDYIWKKGEGVWFFFALVRFIKIKLKTVGSAQTNLEKEKRPF